MTLSATNAGFDGNLDEGNFAKIVAEGGIAYGSPAAKDDLKVTVVTGSALTIALSAGSKTAWGVRCTNDAVINKTVASVSSGVRYDTLTIRRDWQPAGGTVTVQVLTGTSTKAVSSSVLHQPGVVDDDVLALIKVTAGSTIPEVIDWRTFSSKVVRVADVDASPNAVGTVRVFADEWSMRDLDGSGTPFWRPILKPGFFWDDALGKWLPATLGARIVTINPIAAGTDEIVLPLTNRVFGFLPAAEKYRLVVTNGNFAIQPGMSVLGTLPLAAGNQLTVRARYTGASAAKAVFDWHAVYTGDQTINL